MKCFLSSRKTTYVKYAFLSLKKTFIYVCLALFYFRYLLLHSSLLSCIFFIPIQPSFSSFLEYCSCTLHSFDDDNDINDFGGGNSGSTIGQKR